MKRHEAACPSRYRRHENGRRKVVGLVTCQERLRPARGNDRASAKRPHGSDALGVEAERWE
jgi:hypothetical protein